MIHTTLEDWLWAAAFATLFVLLALREWHKTGRRPQGLFFVWVFLTIVVASWPIVWRYGLEASR